MNFEDYYLFYLSKHQNRLCRRLHFAGQVATLAFVACVAAHACWAGAESLWLLLAAPFVVYPFAVAGHLFEGQMPAFFSSNPLYAKLADLRMCWEMLTGTIPF